MSSKSIRFINPDFKTKDFFVTLRKNVDNYFRQNNISRHYNASLVIKTIVMACAYFLPLVAILVFNPGMLVSLLLWTLMGFALAGIGMSVMHDANHGAYAASHKVNRWLGYSINLIGGSVFNWKIQHNMLHHTYTNISEVDNDIDDKFMMRFSPHTKLKSYQRFQFIYAFFLYGILTIYWATVKDFEQFFKYIREGINKQDKVKNRKAFIRIVLSKILFYSIFILIPIFVFHMPVWSYLAGFVLMLFISGILLSIIFQLAHTVDETAHPVPDENNTIENCWAIHQLNTTVNFSSGNKLLTWYMGGLNYQVEHHLFPTISHVHYPKIASIVKQTAKDFGIPYLEHKTLRLALKSHIQALKKFGKVQHAFD